MSDVWIYSDGIRAVATGDTDDGIEFIDAWLLGVLEVHDAGEIVLTAEVVGDFRRAAEARGLAVTR